MKIRKLSRKDDLALFKLIQLLNQKLGFEQFSEMLITMRKHKYKAIGVFEQGQMIAACGYWLGCKFYCGTYLEIDNFVVDEAHRNRGIGTKIITWLEQEAEKQGCQCVMLDAYLTNERVHGFYEEKGFHKLGYHFYKQVGEVTTKARLSA